MFGGTVDKRECKLDLFINGLENIDVAWRFEEEDKKDHATRHCNFLA